MAQLLGWAVVVVVVVVGLVCFLTILFGLCVFPLGARVAPSAGENAANSTVGGGNECAAYPSRATAEGPAEGPAERPAEAQGAWRRSRGQM